MPERDILQSMKSVSSEEIYALLDGVHSADELDIDNLMNDSDTKYIAEEEIQQVTHDTSIIIPEANTHVVKAIPIREEPKKRTKKQKEEAWKWDKKPSMKSKERCELLPEVKVQLAKSASPMDIFEQVTGLDELIEMVVTQTDLYVQQNGRNFEVDTKEMNAFLW